MHKILLSADSTCDLSAELKERYNVHYYPFHIIYRDVDYQDNVDIHPGDIFAGYYEDKSLPKTAASSPAEFIEYFKPFVDEGYEVIHISLGSALSLSHDNACAAARELDHVYVVDSQNLSTGSGQLVIRAGRMIEEGVSAPEIVERLEKLRDCVHASFVLDTMDFLAAGGRCPALLAYAGSILKLKPSILVDNKDGSMGVGKIYRGKLERAVVSYVKDTLAKYDDIICDDVFITYSDIDQEIADAAEAAVREVLDVERIHQTQASCTISSHCGPGTLGVLFVTESACK